MALPTKSDSLVQKRNWNTLKNDFKLAHNAAVF